jgi:hypothetical protein
MRAWGSLSRATWTYEGLGGYRGSRLARRYDRHCCPYGVVQGNIEGSKEQLHLLIR